jgi:Zn-dependent protease with chaperone function
VVADTETAPGLKAGLDAREAGSGVVMRFVLLAVAVIAAGIYIAESLLSSIPSPANGCMLAAGQNPLSGSHTFLVPASSLPGVTRCVARFGNLAEPWWALAAVGVLAGAAALLYWVLPGWKARRGRLVPVDISAPLAAELAELEELAGVRPAPAFVIDPLAATCGAAVFGSSSRRTVCLDAGLVARRDSDPGGFRAVVLHELAHIRNRDVGVTWAAVALWRVFLVALVIPNAAFATAVLLGAPWLSASGVYAQLVRSVTLHALALSAALVVLVYLVRADLLRSR